MDNVTRAELKGLFYTSYKALACIPATWLLLFAGFILRIKLLYPAYAFHSDPKELAMPIHHSLAFWGLVLTFWSLPVTFLLTLALFPRMRWLALSSYVFLFLLGALGFCLLVLADIFNLVNWFLD